MSPLITARLNLMLQDELQDALMDDDDDDFFDDEVLAGIDNIVAAHQANKARSENLSNGRNRP